MKILIYTMLICLFITTNAYADIVIAFGNGKVSTGEPTVTQQIEIDKITNIAKNNGLKVKFKLMPWKRALLLLEKGMIDGVANASYKDDRAKYALYPMKNGLDDISKRLNDGQTYYIFRHQDSAIRWDGKKFINGGKVGSIEKYAVGSDLKKHKNIEVVEYNNISAMIRGFYDRKIEAFAGPSLEVAKFKSYYKNFFNYAVKEKAPIRKKPYYLIFSKAIAKEKLPDVEKIWDGLQDYNTK
jgi:polar amino acid transport system substrate-binding protein